MTKRITMEELVPEMRVIMEHPLITPYTKDYYLTNVAIQQWTEHLRDQENAKFKGCLYWSKEALYKYSENLDILKEVKKTNGKSNINKPEKGLNHEHVIPKKWLISNIFLNEERNQESKDEEDYIRYYLEDYTFACVVTKEEHKRINKPKEKINYTSTMPISVFENGTQHADYHKYWLRYKIAGIEVYKLKWSSDKKTAMIEGQINTDMTGWEDPLIPVTTNFLHKGKVLYDINHKSFAFI